MKRLLIAILLILGVFYFVQAPTVNRQDEAKVYTEVEKQIEAKELNLTYSDRFNRFMNFPEAVQTALHERVSKENYVKSQDIPEIMKDAIVATEDKRFYDHSAIDFYGIARALYVNTVAGETLEGGSTITQQLVKTLFLSSERVWSRKVEEVGLSFMMEHYYTKDEILTMYLNAIYYGNHYYGIKAACEGYFHEKPAALTLGQAALLAGLPQAPTFYNPVTNPVAAEAKREIVLDLMLQQHLITEKQRKEAVTSPLLPSKK